jgi:hypothetical protein
MVPSTSRRGLLAGLGGLLTGSTVAVGATAPTLFPDVLTDEATKHYPTPPEVRDLWRPTVTETHAREAVDRLAETEEAGERLWARTDRSPGPAAGWPTPAKRYRPTTTPRHCGTPALVCGSPANSWVRPARVSAVSTSENWASAGWPCWTGPTQ